jgi:hypothetical protein
MTIYVRKTQLLIARDVLEAYFTAQSTATQTCDGGEKRYIKRLWLALIAIP